MLKKIRDKTHCTKHFTTSKQLFAIHSIYVVSGLRQAMWFLLIAIFRYAWKCVYMVEWTEKHVNVEQRHDGNWIRMPELIILRDTQHSHTREFSIQTTTMIGPFGCAALIYGTVKENVCKYVYIMITDPKQMPAVCNVIYSHNFIVISFTISVMILR